MLERLDLHRRHLGQVLNGILDAGQGGEVLLGEPGEPDVVADGLQLLQDGEQLALVRLRQLGKVVVGNHVRQLLGLAPVLLLVHRHLGNPHQEGCLKAPMTAHNQTGTGRNRDRRPPPVPLDNGSYRGDLGCAVPVGVFRVRLERRGVGEAVKEAVDGWRIHGTFRFGRESCVSSYDFGPAHTLVGLKDSFAARPRAGRRFGVLRLATDGFAYASRRQLPAWACPRFRT